MPSLLHPVSRLLMASLFVASAASKVFEFELTIALMSSIDFPAPEPSLVIAIVVELGAGLALLLGLGTRYAAAALIILVVVATALLNAGSIGVAVSGPDRIADLLKNIAIIGGLLKFVLDGAGPISLDSRFDRKEIIV